MPVSGLNVAPRTENAGAEVPEGNLCVSHIFQKWFQQMPTQDRGGKYMAKKKVSVWSLVGIFGFCLDPPSRWDKV